jgi:ketosteroid isomerase-like protein
MEIPTMTNTDTVKAMYEAFSRGDAPAILSHLTEDVRWDVEGPARLSFTGCHTGHEGAMRFFAGLANEHEVLSLDMTEFFEKPGAVAAFGRYKVVVKATGKTVDTPVGHYFEFRDGKVCRYVNTGAFLEALEA